MTKSDEERTEASLYAYEHDCIGETLDSKKKCLSGNANPRTI